MSVWHPRAFESDEGARLSTRRVQPDVARICAFLPECRLSGRLRSRPPTGLLQGHSDRREHARHPHFGVGTTARHHSCAPAPCWIVLTWRPEFKAKFSRTLTSWSSWLFCRWRKFVWRSLCELRTPTAARHRSAMQRFDPNYTGHYLRAIPNGKEERKLSRTTFFEVI